MTRSDKTVPGATGGPQPPETGAGAPEARPRRLRLIDRHAFLERNATALLVGAFVVGGDRAGGGVSGAGFARGRAFRDRHECHHAPKAEHRQTDPCEQGPPA